jgi:hypothetical protein
MISATCSTTRPAAPEPMLFKRCGKSRLLIPAYRRLDLHELRRLPEPKALEWFGTARWGHLGDEVQQCPKCGYLASHYCLKPQYAWRCRGKDCRAEFTVFAGTVLHGTKLEPSRLLGMFFSFCEAKLSKSAREFAGEDNLQQQSTWLMFMKVREAIMLTLGLEGKLIGQIQADAAYFLKYVRPPNKGTGAANHQKQVQKNAGLDETGRTPRAVSANMTALVVFVEVGEHGNNRYRVAKMKAENQAKLLECAERFCAPGSTITTDQHSGYKKVHLAGLKHIPINHRIEFVDGDGNHTNVAEGFFAQMRDSMRGAWRHVDMQYLEYYGWELAWRQQMLVRDNEYQLRDLLRRVMTSRRSVLMDNYWGKKGPKTPRETPGFAHEVPSDEIRRERGRPRTNFDE